MSVEASTIRFPQRIAFITENVHKLKARFLGETTSEKIDPAQETIARYLGIVLAHQVFHGRLTEDEAFTKMADLKEQGLPTEKTSHSYKFFRARGGTFEWLDLDFQKGCLEAYLPELIESTGENNLT